MREFPQELVDLVIDNVASTKDVGACSAVCQRWLPRSRMHLFCCITLRHRRTIQSFLALVDSASVPVSAFVQTLHLGLADARVSEEHLTRLQSFPALRELCIRDREFFWRGLNDELRLEALLHIHVPRFRSLTRFELALPNDILLNVITHIISSLPFLTHLRLVCDRAYTGIVTPAMRPPDGAVYPAIAPPADALPRDLHTLDIELYRGTSALFRWLLSHREPPIFTSLTLGGDANGEPIEPIETYFARFGPHIESLSLAFWVDGVEGHISGPTKTRAFEARAIALTPRLLHLTLTGQYPDALPTTLAFLSGSSPRLAALTVGVQSPSVGMPTLDWRVLDTLLGTPRFGALKRLSFTYYARRTSLITAAVKALMPQTTARNILM